MREVITYIAYDGTKFTSKKACERYEAPVSKLIDEAQKVYTFYDETMKPIIFKDYPDIERFLDWVNGIIDTCAYIYVNQLPTKELNDFFNQTIDYYLPTDTTGLHRYDLDEDKWVST